MKNAYLILILLIVSLILGIVLAMFQHDLDVKNCSSPPSTFGRIIMVRKE